MRVDPALRWRSYYKYTVASIDPTFFSDSSIDPTGGMKKAAEARAGDPLTPGDFSSLEGKASPQRPRMEHLACRRGATWRPVGRGTCQDTSHWQR